MNDDWRLEINLDDDGIAGEIADHLRAGELEEELAIDLTDSMIVSRDGTVTFVYAGSRAPLEQTRGAIEKFLDAKGWKAELELRHWHHEAEQWEDPDEPTPSTDAERQAEHEELIATEDAETAARGGRAEFEVRVEFPSHGEAHDFAEKLRAEGLEPVSRWRYMVVGAADEDAAKELAERIRAEAPADAEVKAEYSLHDLWEKQPANPFFFLGGLAG